MRNSATSLDCYYSRMALYHPDWTRKSKGRAPSPDPYDSSLAPAHPTATPRSKDSCSPCIPDHRTSRFDHSPFPTATTPRSSVPRRRNLLYSVDPRHALEVQPPNLDPRQRAYGRHTLAASHVAARWTEGNSRSRTRGQGLPSPDGVADRCDPLRCDSATPSTLEAPT